MSYSLPCRLLLIAMFVLMGLNGSGHAAERSRAAAGKPVKSLTGTWYGAKSSITFKADGTTIFEGKRYYYAVTNGGLIQFSKKNSSRAVPYQLSGGKLTLMVNGKPQVYTRKRR
ncbi:MAG: hypothetical protein ABI479_03180 [Gallionella sp.]